MLFQKYAHVLLVLFYLGLCQCEIITIGAISAATLTVSYHFKDYLQCYYECCNDKPSKYDWIQYNPDFNSIEDFIYGQHIATEVVIKSIKQHLKNPNPPKALVLSFHGYTGVGKNHLSKYIAQQIYKSYKTTGKSKFVHTFVSTHFIIKNMLDNGKNLVDFVSSRIEACGRSFFIIDEIDKFPEKYLDVLIPFLNTNENNYNKAIFILISNSGGKAINTLTAKSRSKGIKRENLHYKDFEMILHSAAYSEGGLKNSELLSRGNIDLLVPFLPLEKTHLRLCVISYLRAHHNYSNPINTPGNEFINEVIDQFSFDDDVQLFSQFGCKRVPSKVDILI